ncbi:hypothetical protein K502DRAFT_329981 [Neoconidiobolus thromboides FSU 785]|nr:hypothetical protein K502DRAFT_329981 [Neoconidiobolus thromboides FSU 785]
MGLLEAVYLLLNIKRIHIDDLSFATSILTSDFSFDTDDVNKNTSYDTYKYDFINKIAVDSINGVNFKDSFCLLELFPNLKAIKLIDFILKDIDPEINYGLTTPLLIIVPDVPTIDNELYDKLINIPLLAWLSL